ncbi:MAG: prephenate/arogenate dehydrogenase family protein [Alphaproteobacteria bacterium]|nr:prephenate/arogenate dehydrogenase family protein [Alphaproteobacteria bacterium]
MANTPHKAPRIALIGLGLLGSSLGYALKKKNLAAHIAGAAQSPKTRARALELGFVDSVHSDIKEAVENADIVFLNTPLNAMKDIVAQIAPHLKVGAILTDVGSAKSCVIDDLAPLLPDTIALVPAHPIAGTEETGPDAGFAELFEERWCILTPPDNTPQAAIDVVADLWKNIGCTTTFMDAQTHDLILALTSHIPHLIAYNLVGLAATLESDMGDDIVRYSAGGFRDFTRITASDPIMWRDIFLRNKGAVLDMLGRFNADLAKLEVALRNDDADYLQSMLTRAQDMRPRIIAAGQDTALPNFGRKK